MPLSFYPYVLLYTELHTEQTHGSNSQETSNAPSHLSSMEKRSALNTRGRWRNDIYVRKSEVVLFNDRQKHLWIPDSPCTMLVVNVREAV